MDKILDVIDDCTWKSSRHGQTSFATLRDIMDPSLFGTTLAHERSSPFDRTDVRKSSDRQNVNGLFIPRGNIEFTVECSIDA